MKPIILCQQCRGAISLPESFKIPGSASITCPRCGYTFWPTEKDLVKEEKRKEAAEHALKAIT